MLPFDGLLQNRIISIATVTAVKKTVKLIPMNTRLVSVFCSLGKVILNLSRSCFRLNPVKEKKYGFDNSLTSFQKKKFSCLFIKEVANYSGKKQINSCL